MSDTFWHHEEIDMQTIVDEQARKLQRFVDEATLDKAADTLANFGYVKADGKSRWLELFGTPERAARTLERNCQNQSTCGYCLMADKLQDAACGHYDLLLEWLRCDAE